MQVPSCRQGEELQAVNISVCVCDTSEPTTRNCRLEIMTRVCQNLAVLCRSHQRALAPSWQHLNVKSLFQHVYVYVGISYTEG